MGKLHVFFPPAEQSATQIGIGRETAKFLGMDPNSNPTVDEALIAAVLTAGNACRVNVTVTVGGKAAKAGIQVNGIKTLTGGVCYTDSAGKVMGLATQPTTTLSTPAYVDLPAVSKSVATPAQGTVSATLALAAPVNNTVKTYTSTCTVVFSPYVTGVDVCCIGAGGKGGWGGSGGSQSRRGEVENVYPWDGTGGGGGGAGGGSGQVVSGTGVAVAPGQEYDITVGKDGGGSSALGLNAAGGANGANGADGASVRAEDCGRDSAGGTGGVAGAVAAGTVRGGNGGAGGTGRAYLDSVEPANVTANRGADGNIGQTGNTMSITYWGGTIILKSGHGGSGGGGGGGGAAVDCWHAQDHSGFNGISGTSGTTTAGGTGGKNVSGTYSSSYGSSSFTSGAGGNGGNPVASSTSCGGGAGGSGSAGVGKHNSGLGDYNGGSGGNGAETYQSAATMGSGGNGGGGGGGNGAKVMFQTTNGFASRSAGGGGRGQSTVGAVLIRVHTAQ